MAAIWRIFDSVARLFLYGLLQPDLAHGEAASLIAGLGDGIAAVATGHLFAVQDPQGWYPAFVPDAEGSFVCGQLFDADNLDMAGLDAFEDEGEAYDRRSVAVKPKDGRWTTAQTYCWRGDTRGLDPISHGSFARWLEQTGRQVFGA